MASRSFSLRVLVVFLLSGLGAVAAQSTSAAEAHRSFAVVSDIHFDPFSTPARTQLLVAAEPRDWPGLFGSSGEQALSRLGEDTNPALLASAMTALSQAAGSADFLLVPGDLLAHRFEDRAAFLLGTTSRSEIVRDLAIKTVRYVAASLQAALPGRPVIVALGNNDSDCGDYRIEPQGAFLASTREIVRELAGPDLVAPDFDRTYLAAGYYSMRHPTLSDTTILVLNDVLWSSEYRNSCGDNKLAASEAMMTWLEQELLQARAGARHVWLVHHIPVGIDAYASFQHPGASTCQTPPTSFLSEPFSNRFLTLLRTFSDTIQASFSGHTHRDSYRIIKEGDKTVGLDKIAPAISPIFGNNPSFHMVTYDDLTGSLSNFSTWTLANLEQVSSSVRAEWRQEYSFTEAYGEGIYSSDSVERITQTMSRPDADGKTMRDVFRRFYAGGTIGTDINAGTAEICAISNLDEPSFEACFCGK